MEWDAKINSKEKKEAYDVMIQSIVIEFPTKLMFTHKKIPRMCSKQANKQNIIHGSLVTGSLAFLFVEILF